MNALQELQELDQWVCYKLPSKVPVNPRTGNNAQSSNSSTWASHAEAQEAMHSYSFDGIGFAFSKDDPYVGIDIDDGVSGNQLAPDARKWTRVFDSYTEVSPSGSGIHIWIKGELTKAIVADKFVDHFEAYSNGRYFTVTGQRVTNLPESIESRQSELDSFYKEVMDRRKSVHKPNLALQRKIRDLEISPEGQRSNDLTAVAYYAGVCVTDHVFIESAVLEALQKAVLAWNDETPEKTADTLKRCFQNGKEKKGQDDTGTTSRSSSRKYANKSFESGKPRILLGQQLDVEVNAILAELYRANNPPMIFVRGGYLARIRLDEKQKPEIEILTEHMLLGRIAHIADFYRITQDGEKPAHPTVMHAKLISVRGAWDFPPISGITEIPVIRDDGTILDTPGYDEQSHTFYRPRQGLVIPPIPESPTQEQAIEAAAYAFDFISEFPYVTDSDKANAYGLFLTVVTRSLYPLTRQALLTATKPGTGKTLFFKVLAMLLTGRIVGTTPMPTNETEMGKVLTGLLLSGTVTIFCFDNIEGVISSAKYNAFLTTEVWKDRVITTPYMPELEQHTIPLATGNNLQLGGDMPRRCYQIAMDAETHNPWERSGFTYEPLLTHVRKHRGEIIAAALTMVRAWYVAGQPPAESKVSFQDDFAEWSRITSGVLEFVGVKGFLGNVQSMYDQADVDGSSWTAFLTYWHTHYPSEYSVSSLIATLKQDSAFAELLPPPLNDWFADEEKNKSLSRKMGRALTKKKNSPYGSDDLSIKVTDTRHPNTYRVTPSAKKQSALKNDEQEVESIESVECQSYSFENESENVNASIRFQTSKVVSHNTHNSQNSNGHFQESSWIESVLDSNEE